MNEFQTLISQSKPTLVDFYASWCGPCKMQAPILEEVKKAVGDKANIIKIDVDANQALAAQYNVRSIPTLIIFLDGQAAWRGNGLHQADQLIAKIDEFCHPKSEDLK